MPHRGGRPRVTVRRLLADYPPPTPQPTPCRLWQGTTDRDGYGVLTANNLDNARVRAHRWVWISVNGPIPDGLVVRHKCDNRPCYRLSHLELGTVADNNDDARQRGHLGPVLTLRPSEIKLMFEMRDAGHTYPQVTAAINELRPDDPVSYSMVRRVGAFGREGFDEFFNRVIPDPPTTKYESWRDDRPTALPGSDDPVPITERADGA